MADEAILAVKNFPTVSTFGFSFFELGFVEASPRPVFLYTPGATMSFCQHCPAVFGSEETLAKHVMAIHPTSAKVFDTQPSHSAAASSSAQVADAGGNLEVDSDAGGNLDVAPLLSLLTQEQKDILLLRALANDSSLVYHVLAAVLKPLSPEAATLRLRELDAAGVSETVNAYLEAGAGRNALTMLRVSTISLSDCLGALGTLISRGATGWEESEELEAVERLPAAASLGRLWVEALEASGSEEGTPVSECTTDEDEGLLLQLSEALPKVRAVQPALLLGPESDSSAAVAVDDALRKVRAALAKLEQAGRTGDGPAAKKARS
jgi:DNA-binding Lrp family transcriptional regulator